MVCRILYLESNHIPPMVSNINPEYIGFRYYDGIRISKNIFSDGQNELPKVWTHSAEEIIKMDGGYSSQAMYLFSDKNKDLDDEFWSYKTLPILFIMTLQLNVRTIDLGDVCAELEKRIQDYCVSKKIVGKILSYLTLDEHDIVLVVKCKNYKIGKEITESFHTKDNELFVGDNAIAIKYSFTISSVMKGCNTDDIEGVPDKCLIDVVEKRPGSIEYLIKKLPNSSKNKKYSVLGQYDNLIMLYPESWKEIIELYSPKGPLCNNDEYRKNILSASVQFIYDIENVIPFNDQESQIEQEADIEDSKDLRNDDTTDDGKKLEICKKLKERIKPQYEALLIELESRTNDGRIYKRIAYNKALWQILNSIEKFEDKTFPDYIYVSIYAPLDMLVSKIVLWEENKELQDSTEIYRFLTAINQISQNLLRAEKQFMQVPELNPWYYHVPVKLNAFYAAFVYKVKTYLNEKFGLRDEQSQLKHNYEFMLYPGMNERVVVNQVFHSPQDKNRLLLVEIPERQTFDPKYLMIVLSHEIGHFVGSKLRMRERRYEVIKECLIRMIGLHTYLDYEMSKFFSIDGLDKFLDELKKEVSNYVELERKLSECENAEFLKYDTVLHTEKLKAIMTNGIGFFLEDCINRKNDIFGMIFEDYFNVHFQDSHNYDYAVLQKDKEVFQDAIYQYLFKIYMNTVGSDEGKINAINIYTMIEALSSIIKESFADLVSILILELDFSEYIDSLIKSLKRIEVKNIAKTIAIIRIALVTEAMTKPLDNGFSWTMEDIKTQISKSEDIEFVYKEIMQYHNYMTDNSEHRCPFLRLRRLILKDGSVINVFLEQELLNCLVTYINDCRKFFYENQDMNDSLGEIRNDFREITKLNSCVSQKINHINQVIESYRDCIEMKYKN